VKRVLLALALASRPVALPPSVPEFCLFFGGFVFSNKIKWPPRGNNIKELRRAERRKTEKPLAAGTLGAGVTMCFTAAILEVQNNKIFLLWEISSVFTHIVLTVVCLQH